jgi:hypothetical protein
MKGTTILAAAAVSLAACASSTSSWASREPRPAEDVPQFFATEDGSPAVDSCRNPLVDPRDQTQIRLVRSVGGGGGHRGDYEVPDGRYGVGENELLRIECSTGEPLGIVRN